MDELLIQVNPQESKIRLDLFLMEHALANNLGLSRTTVQKLIHEGKVFLNSQTVTKPHHKLKAGDELQVLLPAKAKTELLAEDIPLNIIYEDEDVLVLNKPAGLVVHPAPGNREHTLVNALLGRSIPLSDINPNRPGIVHRLDKETSGLLVVAKNNVSHLNLVKQFAQHSIHRRYVAIVSGKVEFDQDVIEAPIGRHPVKRKDMAVSFAQNTKYAKTSYKTLKRNKDFSLLELSPFTGRTHQLRVHLAYLGYPILGDTKYGRRNNFSRLALHAKELGFIHPVSGKFMQFSSPIPAEFEEFIKNNFGTMNI
jgi:23S rRNA pseudouridine1911/1915/1917 synthase